MSEEKQEYISIAFDLKAPYTVRRSIVNTIVLILKEICDIEIYQRWENIDIIAFNDNIEKMKKELDSLKIIEFKGE